MEMRRVCGTLAASLLIGGDGYAAADILYPHGLSAPLRQLSPPLQTAASDNSADGGARPVGRALAHSGAWPENTPAQSVHAYVNTGGTRLNVEGLPARAGAAGGAVGHAHYVQIAAGELAVYDKLRGHLQFGPIPINRLFADALDGPVMRACATRDASDATVMYDQWAERWIVSFRGAGRAEARHRSSQSYYQCLAVSASADPTGAYHRYAIVMNDAQGRAQYFDDPKLALWPDAYYFSFNLFQGSVGRYLGPRVCGVERRALIAGQAAAIGCRNAGPAYGPLTPAGLAGSLERKERGAVPLVALGADGRTLRLLRFSLSSARFAHPVTLSVPPFASANGHSGIDQPAPGSLLAPLADRVAPQAMYRQVGLGWALTANHSVRLPDGRIGIRWYEIRHPLGVAVLAQQGTLTEGTANRWMGNIGMDKAGNIAIAYSVASPDTAPGIRYTGREAGDAHGTVHSEEVIVNGAGVQTNADTTIRASGAMTLDPVDGCTFWTTQRYAPVTGVATWRTRIASFRFPSCS